MLTTSMNRPDTCNFRQSDLIFFADVKCMFLFTGLQYNEWMSFDDFIDGIEEATDLIAAYEKDGGYHPRITGVINILVYHS